MSRHNLRGSFTSIIFFALSAHGQIAPKFITGPDQFEFASDAYFVSRGATFAVIAVRFIPGDPSWSGSVNYSTTPGTANTNLDYTPVSGTLHFSGVSYLSFSVPINPKSSGGEKSLGLTLSPSPGDTNVQILRGSAVLYMNLPPPPKLDIAVARSGTVSISWLDDGTGPVLERSTELGTNWTVIATWPSVLNGRTTVVDSAPPGTAFYRLRRLQ